MRIEDRLRGTFSTRAGSALPSEDAWDAIEAGLVRRRRRRAAAGFLAAGSAVALLVVSTAWLWSGLRGGPGPGTENQPPLNPRVTATIRVGSYPEGIAAGEGGVWVALPGGDCGRHVARIDPATNEIVARIPIQGWPSDIAVGFGSVWVEGLMCPEDGPEEAAVVRIDPRTDAVVATVPVGTRSADVAVGEGSVWVTAVGPDGGSVLRIDPSTNEVAKRIPVQGEPRDIVVGEGGVWVLSRRPGQEPHLCPADDSCLGGGSPSLSGLEVLHIDPDPGEVVATFPHALGVGIGEGALWMAVWITGDDPGLVRVDPRTGLRMGEAIRGDFRGFAGEHDTLGTLVVGDGGMWFWGFPTVDSEHRMIHRLNAITLEIDASVAPEGIWIDAALDPSGDILWISNYDETVTRIDLR
jgi:hypothetical protein